MTSDIREFVLEAPVFDDHEHLWPLPVLEKDEDTYRSFVGYATSDLLVSLGPRHPLRSPYPAEHGVAYDESFFSMWRKSRNTGFCRAIERACRDILGVEYSKENVPAIAERLRELKGKGALSFSTDLLMRRANIRWVVRDSINTPEAVADHQYPPFFYFNYRDDYLLVAYNRDTILEREVRWNHSIHTLDDLIDGFMASITSCLDTGKVTAFKIGLAYNRNLDFGYPSKSEAEKAFNRLIFIGRGEKVLRVNERPTMPLEAPAIPLRSSAQLRPLHDYLVHRYIQRACDEGKAVQIHTGYLATVNKDLRNVHPMQLVPLLIKYPTVKFDLFHAGWPYTEEMGAIGKHYPNVWISLCWAWSMNPIGLERALDSWLDAVPYNKIVGFGGDTHHPIAAYGYAMQAREGIARVFEQRISRGDMDHSLAREAAQAILLNNACDLHGVC